MFKADYTVISWQITEYKYLCEDTQKNTKTSFIYSISKYTILYCKRTFRDHFREGVNKKKPISFGHVRKVSEHSASFSSLPKPTYFSCRQGVDPSPRLRTCLLIIVFFYWRLPLLEEQDAELRKRPKRKLSKINFFFNKYFCPFSFLVYFSWRNGKIH